MNNKFNFMSDEYQKSFALYIHIPFCRKKCSYCDFYSISVQDKPNTLYQKYLSYLKKELEIYTELLAAEKLKSIYLGGGTPSLFLPAEIASLLQEIEEHFERSEDIEITMEANPESLNKSKIKGYYQAGVNRLSLGVQSLQDKELNILGRQHSSLDALEIIKEVKQVFENFSIDLMFAFPGQTLESWKQTLQQIIDFSPPHLSIYNLELKSESKLARKIKQDNISLISEEEDLKMYQLARQKLDIFNYQQYEISNFAQQGKESRHNKVYWFYQPYLGLGPAAHSFSGQRRFYNYEKLEKYFDFLAEGNIACQEIIEPDRKELISEFMIMGLRLREGISRNRFKDRFGISLDQVYGSQINNLVQKNLLIDTEKRIYLSEKGLLLGNRVFQKFIC